MNCEIKQTKADNSTVIVPLDLIEHLAAQSKFHINLLRFRVLVQLLDTNKDGKTDLKNLYAVGPQLVGLSRAVFKQYMKECDKLGFWTRNKTHLFYRGFHRICDHLKVKHKTNKVIAIRLEWLENVKTFRANLHCYIARLLNGIKQRAANNKILRKKPLYLRSRETLGRYSNTRSVQTAIEYEKLTDTKREKMLRIVETFKDLNTAQQWFEYSDHPDVERSLIYKVNNHYVICVIMGLRYEPLEYRPSHNRRRRVFTRWKYLNFSQVSAGWDPDSNASTHVNNTNNESSAEACVNSANTFCNSELSNINNSIDIIKRLVSYAKSVNKEDNKILAQPISINF